MKSASVYVLDKLLTIFVGGLERIIPIPDVFAISSQFSTAFLDSI
jgi:hypothetical protein